MHAAPPLPHVIAVRFVTHWLFWQQPEGQFAAEHSV
jgi:hypothetical protein